MGNKKETFSVHGEAFDTIALYLQSLGRSGWPGMNGAAVACGWTSGIDILSCRWISSLVTSAWVVVASSALVL